MFLLFAYLDYYPSGADGDYEGTYDTYEELLAATAKLSGENVVVYDVEKRAWVTLRGGRK